jgi:hypothetical protein
LYIDREPEFMEEEEEDSLDILADVLDEMLQADNMDEEPGENWMPVPPLIGFTSPDNTLYTSSYVIVPPPNMGELTSLQQLYLNNWWLVVSSERYWRALAGCSSLRSLKELHASVAPPAGVTFAHLTWLNVTTSTSPGDTVILLGAFPALEVLWLTVAPRGISHTQVSEGNSSDNCLLCKDRRLWPPGGSFNTCSTCCAEMLGMLTRVCIQSSQLPLMCLLRLTADASKRSARSGACPALVPDLIFWCLPLRYQC